MDPYHTPTSTTASLSLSHPQILLNNHSLSSIQFQHYVKDCLEQLVWKPRVVIHCWSRSNESTNFKQAVKLFRLMMKNVWNSTQCFLNHWNKDNTSVKTHLCLTTNRIRIETVVYEYWGCDLRINIWIVMKDGAKEMRGRIHRDSIVISPNPYIISTQYPIKLREE